MAAGSAALAVLAFAVPAVRTGTFVILGLSSSAAIIYGVRRYRPSGAWSWFAMAAVPTLASASGVLFVLLPGHIGYLKAYLWAVLLIRFAMFAFALIGLVGLARSLAYGPEHVRTSVIDVVILLFGAGLLAGIVATFPFVFGPDRPDFVEAVRAASAGTDVVILVAVLNLVIAVRWSVPVGLLAVGWLAALQFDAVYLLGGAARRGRRAQRGIWDGFCSGGAWGAAALLPGMADLRARDTSELQPGPDPAGLSGGCNAGAVGRCCSPRRCCERRGTCWCHRGIHDHARFGTRPPGRGHAGVAAAGIRRTQPA